MTNIKEYFENLYRNAINDDEKKQVYEYEVKIFNMTDRAFLNWAAKNNIDLNAKADDAKQTFFSDWCCKMMRQGDFRDEYDGD